jgi:hypothetical protein
MTPAPLLELAFTIRAEVGVVLRAGPGALGERQHIAILGGSVDGPMLQGTVLPGGSDWALTRFDGHTIIDAHYSVRAADGTLIYVHNRGLRVCSAEVLARLRQGEPVAPDELYFRSAPVFDAPDGPHRWLSNHLFVATLSRRPDAVVVDVFVVR